MNKILILIVLWSSFAFSQETLDVRFIQTQRTLGSPMAIPVSITPKGELTFFGSDPSSMLSFQPSVQVGLGLETIRYSRPVVLNRFNFYAIQNELGWVEVRRLKWELGLGLAAIVKSTTRVGLIPYKGAMQTHIRNKRSKDERNYPYQMPKTLNDLKQWANNDIGTYQTYGGIQAYAKISSGVVDIASLIIGIRNQFLIEMKKNSETEVVIIISEENINSKRFKMGPWVSTASLSKYNGKKYSVEFTLNMDVPEHHELFREALEGNLTLLQERLPVTSQKLSWSGWDRSYFLGIPYVVGTNKTRGQYQLDDDGVETVLDISESKNTGILAPLRRHQNLSYQTDESIVVVWSSEMKKVNEKLLEKSFLSRAKIMGIRGFDRDLPDDNKLGAVVTQLGINVTKSEVEKIKAADFKQISINLEERCAEFRLSCQKNSGKITQKLFELIGKPWKEMRSDFGLLMLKEPALIHSIAKAMNYKKEVYFKFLSETYQSLEGSSPIDF